MLVSLGGHCRPAPASDKPLRDDDNPPSLASIRPCRLDLAERDPTSDGIDHGACRLRSHNGRAFSALECQVPGLAILSTAESEGSQNAEPARTGVRAGSTLWS